MQAMRKPRAKFIDDCNNFPSSKQAERAAQLGWDAWVFLAAVAIAPWCIVTASDSSRVVEIHRDGTGIELVPNGAAHL